jgi:hypothetical protein
LQTLNYHNDSVYIIIEITNKNLASYPLVSSIIIYSQDYHNKYIKDVIIKTSGPCTWLIQTKENDIFMIIVLIINIQFVFMIHLKKKK